MDDGEEREEAGRNHSGRPNGKGPAAWVRTEDLECELWNAIAEDCSRPFDEDADYDGDDDPIILESEFEDEEELRGSLFRQLADLRPELGALLSEPQTGQKANHKLKGCALRSKSVPGSQISPVLRSADLGCQLGEAM